LAVNRGDPGPATWVGSGRATREAVRHGRPHSHDAQLHEHDHTHLTQYLRHGQHWGHMDPSHVHEHHHAAVSHAPSAHQDPDKEHGREAPHPRPTSSQLGRRPTPILLPPPGNGCCPRSPRSRAALLSGFEGSLQADIGSCEIEPPTSAVNYTYPSRPAPLGAAHRPRHRRVRGGRAVAQAWPCSGGSGRLAAAPWAR
jgi:hypothetical protein